MKKTLITLLGTGKYQNGGYEKTTYCFNNGKEFTTSLFLNAILDNDPSITDVFIIGTSTTGWDVLCEQDEAAWLKVKDECEGESGLQPDSHELITNVLKDRYPMVNFAIKVHTHALGRDTAGEVFNTYVDTVREAADSCQRLVVDITHGFRSMPLLLWQALQLESDSLDDISILYGEYIKPEKVSRVRDLSAYWRFSEIAKAQQAFLKRLDGFAIADFIEHDWPEGAKAIRKLSGIVLANFALQVPGTLRQIANALESIQQNVPAWVAATHAQLNKFHNRLASMGSEHVIVLEYAKVLAEYKLYTQAVIAQQVAVEMFVAGDQYGDYDWWQSNGRAWLKEMKKQLSRQHNEALSRLEELRNQIAHGGYNNKYGGQGFPNFENIEPTMRRTFPAIEALFTVT